MKKFLLSIIAVATVATASAQEFNWGVKAGANFSSVYGDVSNIQMKTDFVGGVFGEYKTNNWFGISAEILYAGEGFKIKDLGQLNTSNLNIPIMANFHVCKFMSLGTGIQPGFMLGAKSKLDDGRTLEEKDNYNSFNLAIPINVRFQLDFGLMFDLRYNIGVTNINKDTEKLGKVYNDGFAVTVGWKF